jgi:hypothetical protein
VALGRGGPRATAPAGGAGAGQHARNCARRYTPARRCMHDAGAPPLLLLTRLQLPLPLPLPTAPQAAALLPPVCPHTRPPAVTARRVTSSALAASCQRSALLAKRMPSRPPSTPCTHLQAGGRAGVYRGQARGLPVGGRAGGRAGRGWQAGGKAGTARRPQQLQCLSPEDQACHGATRVLLTQQRCQQVQQGGSCWVAALRGLQRGLQRLQGTTTSPVQARSEAMCRAAQCSAWPAGRTRFCPCSTWHAGAATATYLQRRQPPLQGAGHAAAVQRAHGLDGHKVGLAGGGAAAAPVGSDGQSARGHHHARG